MSRSMTFLLSLILALSLVGGCTTNPVTGQQELALVSTDQEIAIGRKNYGPYRQAEGGDYVLEPALTRYVQEVGQKLVRVSDRKLPYEFSVVNDSTPNAWALPGGKIAVNRGLLVELDSEAELAAVPGHEIVHAAARHTAQGIQRGWLLQGTLMAAGVALGDSGYRDLAMQGGQLGVGLVHRKYGRDAEREADLYGMRYMARAGYEPEAAVQLQQTFVRLAEGKRANWLAGLFASHPPSQERVDNNRRTARILGVRQGVVGRERYQRMIARLKRNQPAYAAYDSAVKAAAAGKREQVMKLLDEAISIEPRESLFHGLRGDLLAARKRPKQALRAYDKAIDFNADYFKHYLARGFVKRRLGDVRGAGRDFRRSSELLPTAEAKYGQGQLARDAGDRERAVSLFREAASAKSAIGQAAARDLVRLDLQENPSRYVKAAVGLDRQGYLSIAVTNDTAVKVTGIRVAVGRRSGAGIRQTRSLRLRQALAPGERRLLRSDVGPLSKKNARKYGAVVTDARIAD